MHQAAIFKKIKDLLLQNNINNIVTFVSRQQPLPCVLLEIPSVEQNHPERPTIVSAKIKISILSQYCGLKEIYDLRAKVIIALESLGFAKLVHQGEVTRNGESQIMPLTFVFITRKGSADE